MSRILAVLGLVAWILLLRPYPITTFLSTCVACVSCPLYLWLCARMKQGWGLTAYGCALSLAVIVPIVTVITLVTPQAVIGLKTLDRLRESHWWQSPEVQSWFEALDEGLKGLPGLEGGLNQIAATAAGMVGEAARTVLAGGVGLAGGAFQAILNLVIFVMIAMICVAGAGVIRESAIRISGFPAEVVDRFVHTIRGAVYAILTGVIFVAAIQGVLCGIGFAVADVPQPAFWGLISGLVAPIPFVGTALVWAPACLWLWLAGSPLACVGLLLWCAVVVGGVDSVLRPFFLRTGIDAPIIHLVLSIFCGLAAFGPVGIFAGPLMVAIGAQAGRESLNYPRPGQNPENDNPSNQGVS